MGTFATESGEVVTRAAYFAILAARMRSSIGRYAAQRYALNNGSTLSLYRLACQLQAVAS